MKEKIPRGRRRSSRNGASFGPARKKKKKMHLLSCFFCVTSWVHVFTSLATLGEEVVDASTCPISNGTGDAGTRITIAAGTTQAGAVFAKITADGLEIQVLAATPA